MQVLGSKTEKDLCSSPSEWLNSHRLEKIKFTLANSKNILITSGVIKDVVRHWMLREIFNDMVKSGLYNADASLGEPEIEMVALRSDDDKKIKQMRFELKKKYKKCAEHWAKIFWKERMNSLFIKYQDLLGSASFLLVTSIHKPALMEYFHKTRANEFNIGDEQSLRIARLSECRIRKYENAKLKDIPTALTKKLRTIQNAGISNLFSYGESFGFLVVKSFEEPSLQPEIEEAVLSLELEAWLESTTQRILNDL